MRRCRCCPWCRARFTTREIEALKPAAAQPATKDPVVQSKKGSGPISGPIPNFDGICLPFGAPCALPSRCSCLPPDTNGEVGATQYVQMVNSDFAVYSKTGKVLAAATPINQLWKGTTASARPTTTATPWWCTTSWPSDGC